MNDSSTSPAAAGTQASESTEAANAVPAAETSEGAQASAPNGQTQNPDAPPADNAHVAEGATPFAPAAPAVAVADLNVHLDAIAAAHAEAGTLEGDNESIIARIKAALSDALIWIENEAKKIESEV